jgi:DNA-binding response OmpR family regulator
MVCDHHILIVDDDITTLDILQDYLQTAGYRVSRAEDGEQAWQTLRQGDQVFDALISDCVMPRMTGFELLRLVKADSRFKEMPVIFQSAFADRDEIIEGLAAGVYHYLSKPYNFSVLSALLSNAINDAGRIKQLHPIGNQHQHALRLMKNGEFSCQTLEDVKQLTLLLAQLCPDPDSVAIGLSELLLNAIEHGNLGIQYQEKGKLIAKGLWLQEVERRLEMPENQSKYVSVSFQREERQITFIISDQGVGFDPAEFMDFNTDRATHAHGRGIAMSRLLSFDDVEFLGAGNQVRVRVFL